MKDNWTWIIRTLVLRYIGVFVVLLILFLGMTVSGSIISRAIKRIEARKKLVESYERKNLLFNVKLRPDLFSLLSFEFNFDIIISRLII